MAYATCRPNQRFVGLAAICDNIRHLVVGYATGDAPYLGGIGVDPVFLPSSTLYNAALVDSDWYNTSTGSGDLNQNGVPYGFAHTELAGE